MNHLAHLVLAGENEGLRLGAFLGDHVKGRLALESLPPAWARGVELHRFIDTACDRHPSVVALRSGWQGAWRRYGPIVLDVLFDAMLTRHWSRFGPEPLNAFANRNDRMLERHAEALPERLVRFGRWAKRQRLWERYDDRAMLERIFQGLAARHGRPSPLGRGLDILDGWEPEIESVFLELFPDLQRQVGEWGDAYSRAPSM